MPDAITEIMEYRNEARKDGRKLNDTLILVRGLDGEVRIDHVRRALVLCETIRAAMQAILDLNTETTDEG